MKKILKILIPLIILGGVAYQFRSTILPKVLPLLHNIENNFSAIFLKSAPCTKPIPYAIGAFDTKFGISKSYFLSALGEAETIWEKSLGKELFTYKADSTGSNVLKVNLVYDYRQQATSKLNSLGIVVEDNRSSYDTLKAKYTALQKKYDEEKSDFNAQVKSFNQKNEAYEKEVKYWNDKGGAPKDEYDKLQQERSDLHSESLQLQAKQREMNNMVDEINALVVALNRLVDSLNLSVAKYNTTNSARGESFEEGVYSSNGINSEIDIYEFSSRSKLVRVLAHELGHALGLDHVDDPKAIMYKLNQGNSETLTAADLMALKTRCRIK